ncbi:MAG: transaldolase [Bacteroidota bacterium]
MNLLHQLKNQTIVVADSSDFESIKQFEPIDSTTNPSLIYSASQDSKFSALLEDAIIYAKLKSNNKDAQISLAINKLTVNFGVELLKIVPGRISTEVDPRLSNMMEATVKKAHEIIALYEDAGIDRKRILIKIVANWRGIKAAEQLTKEGIHCNLTLVFSLVQAIACANAGVQLISPFVGRILDWYIINRNREFTHASEEPGVDLVKNIYNYYHKFNVQTEIMAASFRNMGEITELAGCDLMTISPKFLSQLELSEGVLVRKLDPETAKKSTINEQQIGEVNFKWMLNENIMASEKLTEGIQLFTDDIIKLEKIIASKL